MPDLIASDLYLRHTGAGGNSFVQCHRVWDGAKFLLSQQAQAHRANADLDGKGPALAAVEQITRQQYLDARGAK